MASKALTKEIRSLVTQKTQSVRKRMSEASTTERLTTGGVSPIGAGLAALAEHNDWAIPLGKVRIPLAPVAGVAAGMTALTIGKGTVAAGLLGAGIGLVDGFTALKVAQMLADRDDEAADD